MKILLLIDNLNSGGAQNQIKNLAIGLHQAGHTPVVMCYGPGDHFVPPLTAHRIPVVRIEKKHRFDIVLPWRIYRHCRNEGVTHIIAFLFTPSFYALFCKWLMGSRLKVIVSERSFVKASRSADFTRRWYRWATFITANSSHQAEYLKQRFPSLNKKIVHIPNGIELPDYQPHLPSEAAFTVICVGRVQRIKNTHKVIHMLRQMHQEGHTQMKVWWVGAGDQLRAGEVDPYFEECLQLVKDSGLSEHWQWLGRRSDVVQLMQQADVLLHASSGEGFPNVVLEAMSAGCLVLVSDFGDHPQVVAHAQNGWVFSLANDADMLEKMRIIVQQSATEREQMVLSARTTIEQEFTIATMTARYLQLCS